MPTGLTLGLGLTEGSKVCEKPSPQVTPASLAPLGGSSYNTDIGLQFWQMHKGLQGGVGWRRSTGATEITDVREVLNNKTKVP